MVTAPPDQDSTIALLETLLQNAPIGFAFIDRQLRFARINAALAAMRGLTVDQILGRPLPEVIPDIWAEVRHLAERTMAGETILEQEVSLPRPPGGPEIRHLLVGLYPLRIGGDVVGFGIVAEDLTERKRAEHDLAIRNNMYSMLSGVNRAASRCRSSDELFAEVCAIAVERGRFDVAWVSVPDGELVRKVATAGEQQDLLQRVVVSLDESDPRSQGPTGRAFRLGRLCVQNDLHEVPMTREWRGLAGQSGMRAAAALPFRERGRVAAVLTLYSAEMGFFGDDVQAALSEIIPAVSFALDSFLREQERARDEAELRLRDRAMGAVSQGIVITDASLPNRPILYASPGFERLTGYSAKEVLGRGCHFLHGEDTDPAAMACIAEALELGQPCSVQILDYRKDGSTFLNDLTLSPVTDAEGRLTHFVAVQTDVSERHRLEQQYRQAQKMEAVGRLAAGIAHDFNNLLTIINGYSDPALAAPSEDDPLHEMLSEIHKAGERAETLTRQLLAFSRQQVLQPRTLSLNTVVSETEKMLRRMIGEDIELVTRLAEDLWPVLADPGQLGQILLNLAVNARDAMPTGGRLTITTENVDVGQKGCGCPIELTPGPYVILVVDDTGHGMDAGTKARLFEPFFTTKGLGKGTGLGLATVHGIVQQSRGCIAVESEVGEGATFTIYLPRAADPADSGPSTSRLDPMPSGSETVLVVEDQEAVRALAARVLRSCGYTVLEATDGREALAVAAAYTGTIDLLVSDVVMPHLGGRALARELTAQRPRCKVLFLSGYTDDALLHHGVLEAEYAFLQKPFTPSQLARKVRMLLTAGAPSRLRIRE